MSAQVPYAEKAISEHKGVWWIHAWTGALVTATMPSARLGPALERSMKASALEASILVSNTDFIQRIETLKM